MQITHEEARRLLQFKSDGRLDTAGAERLHTHLGRCAECRAYQDQLREAESSLRRVMHRQWDRHPLPLSISLVQGRVGYGMGGNVLVATRKLALSVVVVIFAFIAWQSVATGGFARPQQTPLEAIPLVPTPATQGTATNSLQEKCKNVRYQVQEGDSLEEIALKFSSPVDAILAANRVPAGTIRPGLELIVPLCDSTPTSTIHPPTLTITPSLGTNTLAPG